MNLVRYFAFPGDRTGGTGTEFPVCGLTLSPAGPMKAGQDDGNRQRVFRQLGIIPSAVVSLKQIHSRVVRIASTAAAFRNLNEGDGIITASADVVPVISVADCMPIYLFDPVTGCFGVLHSGWKGTGIIRSAVELAADEWGAKPADFKVIFGPHIRSCCYTVDAERADYFTRAFGPSCVVLDPEREKEGSRWPWRLSLVEANRLLCLSLGIQEANILDTNDCTSCKPEYGSSRREGPGSFTHMAAFIHRH